LRIGGESAGKAQEECITRMLGTVRWARTEEALGSGRRWRVVACPRRIPRGTLGWEGYSEVEAMWKLTTRKTHGFKRKDLRECVPIRDPTKSPFGIFERSVNVPLELLCSFCLTELVLAIEKHWGQP